MSDAVSEVLAPFADQELIELPALGDRVAGTVGLPLDAHARRRAVKRGAIQPAPQRGPNGRLMVTQEEARRIVAAAILAVAGGVALVTVLRAVPGDVLVKLAGAAVLGSMAAQAASEQARSA